MILEEDGMIHNHLAVQQHEQVPLHPRLSGPETKSYVTIRNLPTDPSLYPIVVRRFLCGKEVTREILES